ncbi:MAG: transketolase [Anaerolineae bacterium]
MPDHSCAPSTDPHVRALQRKSVAYRRLILQMIHRAVAGHTGGSLSCVDILNVLYNDVMDITPANFHSIERDHYVQSKGHAVEALYAVLADRGFFPTSDLDTLERLGSRYSGHPTRKVPGIEQNTGALGHGLALAVGMALAAKLDGRSNRVYCLMGDGELAEGSIWEASLCAAHYKLDNLVAIVDRNTLQISGRTETVMALEPLAAKFTAFGYAVREAPGNDIAALLDVCSALPFKPGKPNLVLAHTTKGCGISFTADRADWHHHVPTAAEMELAMKELDAAEARLADAD